MSRLPAFVVALLLSLAVLLMPARPVLAAMPAEQSAAFVADLDLLARELPRRHANLFHHTPRADFERAVAELRATLPNLDRGAAVVGLARIAALARDGHTALFLLPFPGQPPVPGIRQLPLQFYAFHDGMRVIAADQAHADLLGARLIDVGGLAADAAIARIAELVPRDNAMGEREYTAWYLAVPEVLEALGLGRDHYSFRFASSSGVERTVSLTPMAVAPDARWADRLVTLPGPRESWVGAGDQHDAGWLARSSEPWWFEVRADGHVHAQINLLRETPQKPFAEFVEQLLAALPVEGDRRLVLDLRLNRGGNGELRWALVHALIRHPAFRQPGRLYVLIGRRTFSAAQLLANALEQHTPALFVGEPTGSSPNHYGELGVLALPQTGLNLVYSMLYWQHDPRDTRPWVPPHLAVQPGYDDLAAGRDPVLQAALDFVPPAPLSSLMDEALARGDVAAALAAFDAQEARFRNPWRNLFENELNQLGYRLLDEKRADDAVAVLRRVVELYPDSWNAWDSLGEAWNAAGVRHRAAYCYARSLRLNPANSHGANVLQTLLQQR